MRDGRIIADTTPQQLLADTGQTDAEGAFLTLIQRDAGSETRRSRRGEER
jgi:ABC-2 type transport system ATP-binding protein